MKINNSQCSRGRHKLTCQLTLFLQNNKYVEQKLFVMRIGAESKGIFMACWVVITYTQKPTDGYISAGILHPIFFLILYSYHNRYISKTLSKYCMYYPGKASPFLTTGFSADCILGSTQKVPLKFTAVKAVFYSVASLSAHCPLSCTNERNHVSSCYALPATSFQNLCYNIQNYHLHILSFCNPGKQNVVLAVFLPRYETQILTVN